MKKAHRRPKLAARPIVTSKLLLWAVAALAILVAVGYVVLQVLSLASGPRLNVVSPGHNQLIRGREIEIAGTAEPGSSIYIDNGFTEVIGDNGDFRIKMTLPEGTHQLIIEARNSIGRGTREVRTVVVETMD